MIELKFDMHVICYHRANPTYFCECRRHSFVYRSIKKNSNNSMKEFYQIYYSLWNQIIRSTPVSGQYPAKKNPQNVCTKMKISWSFSKNSADFLKTVNNLYFYFNLIYSYLQILITSDKPHKQSVYFFKLAKDLYFMFILICCYCAVFILS